MSLKTVKKRIGAFAVSCAMAVAALFAAPAMEARAEGSWENVIVDGLNYQCITDTEDPDYGKAFVVAVEDTFKTSGTVANVQSSVTYDGKSFPVFQVGGYTSAGFSGCTALTQVNIPSSVTRIEDGAFSDCTALQSITIPDSVTYIGAQAFAGSTALSSVTLSNNLQELKELTFFECSSLKQLTIPASVEKIKKPFGTTGETVESISFASGSKLITLEEAFEYTSIKSIELPDSITTIGEASFGGCKELTSVKLPASLTTIEKSAFQSCPKLTTVILPKQLTSIGENAFNSYVEDKQSGLANIYIPASVTSIADNAFNDSNPIIFYGHKGTKAESFAGSKSNISFVDMEAAPTATGTSDGIQVSWTNIPFASGYKIEQSTDNQNFHEVGSVGQNVTSFTDKTAVSGNTYYYRIVIQTLDPNLASLTTRSSQGASTSNATAGTNPTTQQGTEAPTGATTGADTTGADIGGSTQGTGTITLSNPYFSIEIPASWEGKYVPIDSDDSMGFVSRKCLEESGGNAGSVFDISVYTDKSFQELPDFKVLKTSGAQYYVLTQPTDVQTYGLSAEATEEWGTLYQGMEGVCASLKVTEAPATPVIKNVKATSAKKLKVNLKSKVSGASGYQVVYAKNKKMTNRKGKSFNGTSVVLSGLKKNTKYYVSVRAYKTVEGKKIYSKWTALKTGKTKK